MKVGLSCYLVLLSKPGNKTAHLRDLAHFINYMIHHCGKMRRCPLSRASLKLRHTSTKPFQTTTNSTLCSTAPSDKQKRGIRAPFCWPSEMVTHGRSVDPHHHGPASINNRGLAKIYSDIDLGQHYLAAPNYYLNQS